jgi:hypothetical protein
MAVQSIKTKKSRAYTEFTFNNKSDVNFYGPSSTVSGTGVFQCRYEGFAESFISPSTSGQLTPVHTFNINDDDYNITAVYFHLTVIQNGNDAASKLARTAYIHGIRRGNDVTSNAEFVDGDDVFSNLSGAGLFGLNNNAMTLGLRFSVQRINVQGIYRIYELNY